MAFLSYPSETFPQIATNAAIKWNVNVRAFDFWTGENGGPTPACIGVKCLACQETIVLPLWDDEAKGYKDNRMVSYDLEKIFVRHRECAMDVKHKDMTTRMLDILDRKTKENLTAHPAEPLPLRPKRAIKL